MSKKDDTPIGKMLGETLRKKINAEPLPKKKTDKPPKKPNDPGFTGVRG